MSPYIVIIEGREAIPVRVIPYITDWHVHPGALVQELSRNGGPDGFYDDVFAYHIQYGHPVQMRLMEWDAIGVSIDALEAEIRDKFPKETKGDDQQFYAAWQQQSAFKLPAGVFMWRDEFERGFEKLHDFYLRYQEYHGGREIELNYTPLLPDGVRERLLAGFEKMMDVKEVKLQAKPEQPEPQNVQTVAERMESSRQRLERAITPESSGRAWSRRHEVWTAHKIPDWEFWRDMPEVGIGQACALSLNLDHDTVISSDNAFGMGGLSHLAMRDFPNEEAWKKFTKRHALLQTHMLQPNGRILHSIRLADFVTWASSLSTPWEMPPELVALAQKQGVQADAIVTEAIPDTDRGDKEEAPLENWMMQVQEEAAKRWKRQRKSGCNPTRNSLKDELAKWCKETNIRTTSYINPTAEYLYRHVLSTKRWTPPKDD